MAMPLSGAWRREHAWGSRMAAPRVWVGGRGPSLEGRAEGLVDEELLTVGTGERVLVGVDAGADGAVIDGIWGQESLAGEIAQSQAKVCE